MSNWNHNDKATAPRRIFIKVHSSGLMSAKQNPLFKKYQIITLLRVFQMEMVNLWSVCQVTSQQNNCFGFCIHITFQVFPVIQLFRYGAPSHKWIYQRTTNLISLDKVLLSKQTLKQQKKWQHWQEGILQARLHSPIKYIIDLFPDVCSQAKKLAIDPVKGGFQEVPFSWVFTVKQF